MEYLKKAELRTIDTNRELCNVVTQIIENVCENKDRALRESSKKFDGCSREAFMLSKAEIENAYNQVSQDDIADIKKADKNIRSFAQAQKGTLQDVPSD